jgi:hypothetical protein
MMPLAKFLLVPILLMPGGFVLAALLWLLQRRRTRTSNGPALPPGSAS